MSYHRLLCATDLSVHGEQTIVRALFLARALAAELIVLHVIEHFPEDLPVDMAAREDEDPKTYLVANARNRLAALLNRLGADEVEQHVIVSRRSARHEIIATAQHVKADLLIVGTAPRGMLAYLGSTAGGLLHDAHCDLLVVKAQQTSG